MTARKLFEYLHFAKIMAAKFAALLTISCFFIKSCLFAKKKLAIKIARETWMLKIRHFSRVTAVALTIFCFCAGAAAALSPEPDHITLTWTQDPRTTQTITWRTDTSVSSGQVRYYENTGSEALLLAKPSVLSAKTSTLETSEDNMNVHSVSLTDLSPGKRYSYQVGSGEIWSQIHSFKTEPLTAGDFKFLVFGDSQSYDYGVWRTTLQRAYQAHPDAAFFTNVGDLVDVGQDYAEWESWFAAVERVVEKLPIMPLTGNHESYTPERSFSRPEFFTAQFMVPGNGPAGMERQAYSFDYGEVHFVMLDSQSGEQREFLPDLLARQREWLAADLAATKKKWKVAFIHRPIYGNKPGGVNENLRQAFAPIFDQFNVDLVFTAHDHVVARTFPIYNDEIAEAPDRGTIYAATGRSGTKTYENVEAKEWNAFFYNPVEEPNYLVVTVSGPNVTVKAFTQSGELIDEWTVNKMSEKPKS